MSAGLGLFAPKIKKTTTLSHSSNTDSGRAKNGRVFANVLNESESLNDLFIRLMIGLTWVLDRIELHTFKNSNQHKYCNMRTLYA